MPFKSKTAPAEDVDVEKDEFDDIDDEAEVAKPAAASESVAPTVEEVEDPLDDESPTEVSGESEESEKSDESEPVANVAPEAKESAVSTPADPVLEPKKGPKINFAYEDPSEDLSNPSSKKREETLEDLASKYKESQAAEATEPAQTAPVEGSTPAQNYNLAEEKAGEFEDEAEAGQDIPRMRAQMPGSGVYSSQGRSSGELYQTPSMKSSFNKEDNGNPKPKSNSKLHFVILTAIGLAVLASAVYLLKYQFKAAKPLPSPTPAPVVVQATPSPSPTPVPIDRSKYSVRILNATGKSGLAKTVADQLKALGYKIDKTGNAESADSTTVKAKSGNDDLIKQLITDLGNTYPASSASGNLITKDPADAEVTLGGK